MLVAGDLILILVITLLSNQIKIVDASTNFGTKLIKTPETFETWISFRINGFFTFNVFAKAAQDLNS